MFYVSEMKWREMRSVDVLMKCNDSSDFFKKQFIDLKQIKLVQNSRLKIEQLTEKHTNQSKIIYLKQQLT